MKYLHTMVRARDLDETLDFYCNKLGLVQVNRHDSEAGTFFPGFPGRTRRRWERRGRQQPAAGDHLELGPERYDGGRNFGHLAYRVENIYALCQHLVDRASPSTGHRGTGTWPLSARPTVFPLSCCRRAPPCRHRSPGNPWRIPELVIGTAGHSTCPGAAGITTRLIVLLTLCAAIIIGLGMLVDYRLSREAILQRLQRESDDTVRAVVIDMENWLQGLESSTLLLARVLQQRDYSHAGLAQMLRDAVDVNTAIFGARPSPWRRSRTIRPWVSRPTITAATAAGVRRPRRLR